MALRVHWFGAIFAAVLSAAGLAYAALAAPAVAPPWIGPANNAFACDLYGKLAGAESGNLFFSPASIETALAMTYSGARGQTATQMRTVLHLPETESVHRELGAFLNELTGGKSATNSTRSYQLSVANGLWGQKGYEFRPEFLKLLKSDYGAPLHEVDYFHNSEKARQDINAWVGQETRDKIRQLIPPGALSPTTRLVLCNATYFKGNWLSQFDRKLTRNAPFHVTTNRTVDVPMMEQTGEYRFFENGGLQGLELPYAGQELSMVILLPRRADGLAEMERMLTAERLSQWLAALRKQKVAVIVPRIKLETGFELSQTLEAMGMTEAFSNAADFSGMTSREGLFLSHVIHKAFVDVNEEGTEAAAATGVVAVPTAVMRTPLFRADHPFLFLIRHQKSGAILFLGRLSEPSR